MSRGDFLLSINGASLAGLAHSEVMKVLHQAQLHKQALVVIKKGNDQPRSALRQELPSANGKGPLTRKTLPLEPGAGKLATDGLQGMSSWLMKQAHWDWTIGAR